MEKFKISNKNSIPSILEKWETKWTCNYRNIENNCQRETSKNTLGSDVFISEFLQTIFEANVILIPTHDRLLKEEYYISFVNLDAKLINDSPSNLLE